MVEKLEMQKSQVLADKDTDFAGWYNDVVMRADPASVRERVQQLAVRSFDVMGCEGLARVDVFLTDDGDVVVNEINTMPGFTPTSMFPLMWAATGLEYPKLVDRLIRMALRRGTGLH